MENMETLETKLKNMGLKIWAKGGIKRIYVKSKDVKKLIDFDTLCLENSCLEKNTRAIFKNIDCEGAWLNCDTGQLESKKPTVQAWFEYSEFSERCGYKREKTEY